MATIFDVAKYITDQQGDVTNMQLHKLAYYCQAWSLAWYDVPLFQEDFEAWANGPVCPELFEAHRGHYSVGHGFFGECDTSVFAPEQIETMDAVLKEYGNIPPAKLSELVHRERPWKETRNTARPGDPCFRVIEKELIQEYYAGIMDLEAKDETQGETQNG